MQFDDDAAAQIQRIKANLAGCSQTTARERKSLRATIAAQTRRERHEDLTIADIQQVQSAVRSKVATERWYFRGNVQSDMAIKSLYSTQTEIRMEKIFLQGLQVNNPELTSSEALDVAQQLMDDLTANPTYAGAKLYHGALPLHEHASPMWLVDPDSAKPLADAALELLPARLGIAPRRTRYVLLALSARTCHSPRFADSGAYPYWRPGGKTFPIEQCPKGYEGFDEVVSDGITISNLRRPLRRYQRTI